MTPAEKAARVYSTEECARPMWEDISAHLLNGYLFSTPEFFVMARPVSSTGAHSDIVDPSVGFHDPDCWHIYLMAGDMLKALELMPYELPMVSFERKNKLRFWPLATLKRKLVASGEILIAKSG